MSRSGCKPDDNMLCLSVRVYRMLLLAYPQTFRNAYKRPGDDANVTGSLARNGRAEPSASPDCSKSVRTEGFHLFEKIMHSILNHL